MKRGLLVPPPSRVPDTQHELVFSRGVLDSPWEKAASDQPEQDGGQKRDVKRGVPPSPPPGGRRSSISVSTAYIRFKKK